MIATVKTQPSTSLKANDITLSFIVSDSMQAPFSISESQLDAARKSYQ